MMRLAAPEARRKRHRVPATGFQKTATATPHAEYRIAQSIEEIRSGLGLVYEAYRRQGYIDSNPFGVRVIPQHVYPSTQVLVASVADDVVATSTLVLDTPDGILPLQSIFQAEVSARRQSGRVLAEASCLADRSDCKPPLSVVVRLMALTIQVAKYRGADELLAVVHPHHVDFYTRFLGFQGFGKVKVYSAVRNHLAAAISLDLHRLQEQHPQAYRRAFLPPFSEETLRYRPLADEARVQLQEVLACTE